MKARDSLGQTARSAAAVLWAAGEQEASLEPCSERYNSYELLREPNSPRPR
jgi:hypothetical protein